MKLKWFIIILILLIILFNLVVIFSIFSLIYPVDKPLIKDNSFKSKLMVLYKKLLFLFPKKNMSNEPESFPNKKYFFKTQDGHKIETFIMEGSELKNVLVIICHGYGHPVNYESLSRLKFLVEKGFSAAVFNYRGFGKSSGKFTYVGIREYLDVDAVVTNVCKMKKYDSIYLFGISMGAAAIIKYLYEIKKYPDKIKGIIIESCYYSLENAIKHRFENNGIPLKFYSLFDFYAKTVFSIDISKMDISKFAESVNLPVLFIAGENDIKTRLSDMKNLYSKFPEKDKFVLIENATHVNVFESNPSKYIEKVTQYIKNICNILAIESSS